MRWFGRKGLPFAGVPDWQKEFIRLLEVREITLSCHIVKEVVARVLILMCPTKIECVWKCRGRQEYCKAKHDQQEVEAADAQAEG